MGKLFRIAGMGLSGLMVNRGRSALSMLGIVIGVFAVILLTSLGHGVQEAITGKLTGVGSNLLTISPGNAEAQGRGPFAAASASTLTRKDVKTVENLPTVAAASASVPTAALAGTQTIPLTGVDPSYEKIRSVNLAAGRFVERSGEVVLETPVAKDLLKSGPKDAVGKTIKIKGDSYKVVGVLEIAKPAFGPPVPETSYVITDDAIALSGARNVGQIVAEAANAGSVDRAAKEIGAALKSAHGGAEDFNVLTQKDLLSVFTLITDLLTVLLGGIASISLLVGGIGIMNIMLVSVAERTREIGVRKAIGATDTDVLLQFLFEALLLTLIGGLAGIGLGVGVSALLPEINPLIPTSVTGTSIVLAFGVSALVGLVFGVLPAYRSARLQPVEALRRE
jgi:putative ABC transport system permease protein